MNFLLVFIGGGIGSCLRYSLSLWIPIKLHGFPWATLTANLLSCLIIGVLIGQLTKGEISQQQKLLLITGFCGGFSTFSAFGLEVFLLIKNGSMVLTIGYVLVSVVIGSLLVVLGSALVSN